MKRNKRPSSNASQTRKSRYRKLKKTRWENNIHDLFEEKTAKRASRKIYKG